MTHFAEKITLDALAERFYINKFYLTRVFKEQFGLSVTSYLTQLRITQAKAAAAVHGQKRGERCAGMRAERRKLFFPLI